MENSPCRECCASRARASRSVRSRFWAFCLFAAAFLRGFVVLQTVTSARFTAALRRGFADLLSCAVQDSFLRGFVVFVRHHRLAAVSLSVDAPGGGRPTGVALEFSKLLLKAAAGVFRCASSGAGSPMLGDGHPTIFRCRPLVRGPRARLRSSRRCGGPPGAVAGQDCVSHGVRRRSQKVL